MTYHTRGLLPYHPSIKFSLYHQRKSDSDPPLGLKIESWADLVKLKWKFVPSREIIQTLFFDPDLVKYKTQNFLVKLKWKFVPSREIIRTLFFEPDLVKYKIQNFHVEWSVTPWPLKLLVTTHGDNTLAPQTNTSLSSALWPYFCAPRKTCQ